MINGHDLDEKTAYCLRCGASAQSIIDTLKHCVATPNVIAVSHIICKRRWAETIAGAIDLFEENNDGRY